LFVYYRSFIMRMCWRKDKIIKWYEDDRAKGIGEKWGTDFLIVRDSAEKFVTWLQEAEEESDD
jgi:eIF4-gamma/eIF5/eIF2-epsilon